MYQLSIVHKVSVIYRFCMVLAVMLLCTACDVIGNRIDEAKWREEVLLHDGSMIEVSRSARAYSSGFPTEQRGKSIDEELHYEPLGVHWKINFSRNNYFLTFSFEIFDGVPYLAGSFEGSDWCADKPPTHYLARFFKWQDGQWIEVKQEDFPVDQALMNLYETYWGNTKKQDARGLITWYQKHPGNEYRTIKEDFEKRQLTCRVYANVYK